MQSSILIDTGPLVALFHRRDHYHRRMIDFLRNKNYLFVSTLAVFAEVSYMLSVRLDAQLDFFEWVIRRGVILQEITQNDIPRIVELTKKYADLPMDFADATLVVAAEKTGIREIISIDADFDVYRLTGKMPIHNVFTDNHNDHHH